MPGCRQIRSNHDYQCPERFSAAATTGWSQAVSLTIARINVLEDATAFGDEQLAGQDERVQAALPVKGAKRLTIWLVEVSPCREASKRC